MNLQIINGCAGTEPRLPTVGTDPGRRYIVKNFLRLALITYISKHTIHKLRSNQITVKYTI